MRDYHWVGGDEGEFEGSGLVQGGLLFAAVPDHLRAEFGPTCVVLWFADGRDDSVFYGTLADRVRESYLELMSIANTCSLAIAG